MWCRANLAESISVTKSAVLLVALRHFPAAQVRRVYLSSVPSAFPSGFNMETNPKRCCYSATITDGTGEIVAGQEDISSLISSILELIPPKEILL